MTSSATVEAPTIGGISVCPSDDATVILRCTAMRKGRVCDHIVTKVPLAIWEQVVADEIEQQCGSCGTVYRLKEWR